MATIDGMRVLFGQGTSATFQTELKQPNQLYFLTDTQELYLGSVRYAIGKDVTFQVTGTGDTVANASWDSATKTLTIVLGNAGDAASVISAIQTAIAPCVTHIYSQRGSSILVDDTNKSNVEISLNIAEGVDAGNVLLEECSDGLRGNVNIPEVPVKGIRSDEKIISLDDSKLFTTLSIDTEVRNNITYVVLKGVNGAEISRFDASDFVKSGMLQSVTLEEQTVGSEVHKFLVMTFLVAGGTTKTVQVDLNDLLDVYVAAENGGLRLDNNNAFSIDNNVAANTSGVNTNQNINFNSTVSLNTIMYDAHGLITGEKTITFSIPGLSGSVGTSGNVSKVLTFVSMSPTGTLSGEYANVVTSVASTSTNNQIPTAKSVYDLVDSSVTKWQRF